MWDPGAHDVRSSFVEPVSDPGTAPDDSPLVCLSFNRDWLPYVVAGAAQLAQPRAWSVDKTVLPDLLGRVQRLIEIIGTAGGCQLIQYGSVDLTIVAGQVSASAAVVFDTVYADPPIVGVASSDSRLHSYFSAIVETGFSVNLDADVTEVEDATGTVNWWALGMAAG